MASGEAGQDVELAGGQAEALRQEGEQFPVGLAIDGRCLEADFEGVAMGALNVVSCRAWRGMDGDNASGRRVSDPRHGAILKRCVGKASLR